MGTYLDAILDAHRAAATAAAAGARDTSELRAAIEGLPPTRGFAAALSAAAGEQDSPNAGTLAVIAEIKRRSPSKGDLDVGLDPARVAREFGAGGATCLSVLTDERFFGGSAGDLVRAREATAAPVLRKDFTVSTADILDARLMGADAVLLIVAALDDGELRGFLVLAADVGLDALVEVHDEAELNRALASGATLIGVNQRDLKTFAVDEERAERVAASIPAGVLAVAESGIRGPADARRLAAAGYHAVLVGEHLVTAPDRAAAVAELRVPMPRRPLARRLPA